MKNKIKNIVAICIAFCIFMNSSSQTFAHVVVRPNQVGVAAFQTFTVGVPVEKDVPTTAIRVIIPDGLQYVTPNVKPGWEISVKKAGEGESAKVTEITWTGGEVPSGQRDEFLFSAQVPSKESTVVWKAYQTYADGSVVSWDQDPKANHSHDEDFSTQGPYSETKVVNDLAASNTQGETQTAGSSASVAPLALSGVAVLISTVALALQLRRRK